MKTLGAFLAFAVFAAACTGMDRPIADQPIALDAPPTKSERQTLGPDAYDEYFLVSWRRCTQWASDDTCWKQIYGGDDGIP